MNYVISDVHGNKERFFKMLELIDFKDGEDSLFVLGDVVDRGDDGIEILEYIMFSKSIHFILGNHEAMMYNALISRDKIDTELWLINEGGSDIL